MFLGRGVVSLENQTEKDRGTVICSSRKEIEKFFMCYFRFYPSLSNEIYYKIKTYYQISLALT